MQYISSDTNVWIDFITIQREELPFRLPYIYIMSSDAIEDELLSPPGIRETLLSYGLRPVEMTESEFFMAEQFGSIYLKLSTYDRIALAIARCRKLILLTGDRALRSAAAQEDVRVMGTLGILDQLIDNSLISPADYQHCIRELLRYHGGPVRLPKSELLKRLSSSASG